MAWAIALLGLSGLAHDSSAALFDQNMDPYTVREVVHRGEVLSLVAGGGDCPADRPVTIGVHLSQEEGRGRASTQLERECPAHDSDWTWSIDAPLRGNAEFVVGEPTTVSSRVRIHGDTAPDLIFGWCVDVPLTFEG